MTIYPLQALLLLAGALFCAGASAQAYPSKPVKLIVAFGPGTATDAVARFVGNHISKSTGQPVIVDNKGGANGFIASEFVAKSAPDGYTLLITTQTTHAANPSLFRKLPYDPVKEFTPVSSIGRGALVLVAAPGFPANNVAELTALAKKQPGKLSFGAGNASARAGGELYRMLGNVDLLHVPYKSAPQAILDLLSGRIDLIWADVYTGMTQVKAGKLKALATTGAARLRTAPGVPTMIEQGVAGYELYAWTGAFLPAKAPVELVRRVNELIVAAIKADPAFFDASGSEAHPLSPEEFARFQAREIALWAKIVKAAGIEPE